MNKSILAIFFLFLGCYLCGCASEPTSGDTQTNAAVLSEAAVIDGICRAGSVATVPNLSKPLRLAVDNRFTDAEVSLIVEGVAAWQLEIAEVTFLAAHEAIPEGFVAVARCVSLDASGAIEDAAGTQRGGILGFKAPLVTLGLVSHEVGHMLGLSHSDDERDVMHSPVKVDYPNEIEIRNLRYYQRLRNRQQKRFA